MSQLVSVGPHACGPAVRRPGGRPPPAPLPGVLVVDDVEEVRRMIGLGLRGHGFAVWLAGDASEAVKAYTEHHTRIGVVLLDVRMPGRDGPGTLLDLQAVDPGVLACFMTGDAGEYTPGGLLARGAAAVICKPFRLSELAFHLIEITASKA